MDFQALVQALGEAVGQVAEEHGRDALRLALGDYLVQHGRDLFADAARMEALKRRLFLSPAEASELTGWSTSTLEKWRADKVGPSFSKGPGTKGGILYRPEDLINFYNSGRRATADDDAWLRPLGKVV